MMYEDNIVDLQPVNSNDTNLPPLEPLDTEKNLELDKTVEKVGRKHLGSKIEDNITVKSESENFAKFMNSTGETDPKF